MTPRAQPEPASEARAKVDGRARTRPDPKPARLMVSAGALAALSLIIAGLARPPAAADTATVATLAQADPAGKAKVEAQVRYVRLKPGQKAPPGAKVIREATPAPRVVVKHVAAPSQGTTRAPVARTRQSGG